MARKRYPSDDKRRKQRPHAKVHLSTRSHPRYGEVFEDPEARGVIWGLWLLAVQYHAAQSGDRVTLGLGDLVWLTGREQRAAALRVLHACCTRMGYAVENHGKRVVVEVRNLKQKQGFDSATPTGPAETPQPSEEPKYRSTEEPNTRRGVAPVSAAADWSLALADLLVDLLKPVPGARIPRGARSRWAREIEALAREAPELAANGADPSAHLEAAIHWALGPENLGREYEVVIRSGKALREKWPKLVAARRRAQANGDREETPEERRERHRRIEERARKAREKEDGRRYE